jgi:hypothetical protein
MPIARAAEIHLALAWGWGRGTHSSFIKDKDVRRSQESPGERYQLALSLAEIGASLVNGGIQVAIHTSNVLLQPRMF